MSSFDTVEILAEFSKALRHAIISLESLHDLDGMDQNKVEAVADSVRRVHSEATGYLVSVIGATSAADLVERRR